MLYLECSFVLEFMVVRVMFKLHKILLRETLKRGTRCNITDSLPIVFSIIILFICCVAFRRIMIYLIFIYVHICI